MLPCCVTLISTSYILYGLLICILFDLYCIVKNNYSFFGWSLGLIKDGSISLNKGVRKYNRIRKEQRALRNKNLMFNDGYTSQEYENDDEDESL